MLGKGIEQLQAFVVFAVLGLFLSAIYIFALGLLRGKLVGVIFDAIFGAVSLWLVFITNLNINNGEFRLFVFLGLAAGVIICVVTCKTLLDKASSALYNLFTVSSEDEEDGTHILQQKNVDTVRSGDAGTVDSGVYAAHDVNANGGDEKPRRANTGSNKRRVRQRSRTKRSHRVYENPRIH